MVRLFATLILLCCATVGGAVDVQAALEGNWKMVGLVDSSEETESDDDIDPEEEPSADAVAVFSGSTITVSPSGEDKPITMTWKVLAEKPEGIEIEMAGWDMLSTGDDKPQSGRLLVFEDSIVFAQMAVKKPAKAERGMKFVRADGKPIGLPPTVKQTPSAVPPTDPELARQITCELRQVKITREIDFHGGDLTAPHVENSCALYCAFSLPKGVTVLLQGGGQYELLEAVTDSGENLVRAGRYERYINDDILYQTLYLAAPINPAKVIRSLRANFQLVFENAAGKTLELPQIATWVGKEQQLPDTQVSVMILGVTEDRLKYRIDGDREDSVLKSVVIVSATGNEFQQRSHSRSTVGGNTTCTTQTDKPIPPRRHRPLPVRRRDHHADRPGHVHRHPPRRRAGCAGGRRKSPVLTDASRSRQPRNDAAPALPGIPHVRTHR